MESLTKRWQARGVAPDDEPDLTPPTLLRLGLGVLWEAMLPLFLVNLVLVGVGVPLIIFAAAFGFLPATLAVAAVWFPGLTVLTGIAWGRLANPLASDRENGAGALRRGWRSVIVLGVIISGLIVAAVAMLEPARATGGVLWFVWGFQIMVLALFLVILVYAVPVLASQGGDLRAALRESTLLVALNPLSTAGVLGLLVVLGAAVTFIGFGVLLLAPMVLAAFLAANYVLAEQRRTAA